MDEQKTTLRLSANREEEIKTAGRLLREGGLVAIPTETVYGLAANALNCGAADGQSLDCSYFAFGTMGAFGKRNTTARNGTGKALLARPAYHYSAKVYSDSG